MFAGYNDQQAVILSVIALFVVGGPLLVTVGGVLGYLFRKVELKQPELPKFGPTVPA